MGSKNPFRSKGVKPPFQVGDFVTPCVGKRSYGKWRHGEFREVHDVYWDDTNDPYGSWVLVIWNPMKSNMHGFINQCSKYNPANFTKESYLMPAPHVHNPNCRCQMVEQTSERGQFIGLRVTHPDDYATSEAPSRFEQVTRPCNTWEEVFQSLEKTFKPEDEFVVVKVVKRIEVLPPLPPIRVTDLR